MAPRRTTGSGLATASNCTVPSPWPLPPALIVSQGFSDDAVQAHSRAAVTATPPVPPEAGTGPSGPATDTVHFDIETYVLRANIQSFLDARACIVKKGQQCMITLPLHGTAVWLGKNARYFI